MTVIGELDNSHHQVQVEVAQAGCGPATCPGVRLVAGEQGDADSHKVGSENDRRDEPGEDNAPTYGPRGWRHCLRLAIDVVYDQEAGVVDQQAAGETIGRATITTTGDSRGTVCGIGCSAGAELIYPDASSFVTRPEMKPEEVRNWSVSMQAVLFLNSCPKRG